MTVIKSIALFVVAAIAEVGGAWLVWQGWREHRGLWDRRRSPCPGRLRLRRHLPAGPNFGRILAAYGGIFVGVPWPGKCSSTGSDPTDGTSLELRFAWSGSS
ncbi:drug/metabolite transporter superfamily protein YnfA [Kribbella italica]|uniref:Drug/metabolite transporter superfamily protein YnfA n=1 Tax=Kribbella italica TaxID=1540520 RepID=A0A7W9MR57_9ACTN|nr:drug/metabolite transporter superfamily protein YnfA [Kribbella italica]